MSDAIGYPLLSGWFFDGSSIGNCRGKAQVPIYIVKALSGRCYRSEWRKTFLITLVGIYARVSSDRFLVFWIIEASITPMGIIPNLN